ncbi:MAG TPA: hypothetical protein VMX17_03245 [Candidatus Glassbacteria bacterium]|nr:hypothetical protein [Candidatus Glassbacteria bacterium]
MKRKIKVWNKIRLYEASVVGIPAYPDAHNSVESFSLVKALSNASLKRTTGFVEEGEDVSDELNLEEKETMEEKGQAAEIKKQEEPKVEEKEKSETETEEPTKEEAEKKSDMNDVIAKAIKDGIKDGLKELETERGLVEKQIPTVKSLGELAIDKGLFVIK